MSRHSCGEPMLSIVLSVCQCEDDTDHTDPKIHLLLSSDMNNTSRAGTLIFRDASIHASYT